MEFIKFYLLSLQILSSKIHSAVKGCAYDKITRNDLLIGIEQMNSNVSIFDSLLVAVIGNHCWIERSSIGFVVDNNCACLLRIL